ncbi:MAG: DUF6152 family protein [Gammaproteobacteria bacterium]
MGERYVIPLQNSLIAAAVAVLVWILPAAAHHSHGNYVLEEYTHLEGTVREVHWINPHTWIYLEVAGENGEGTLWALEGGGIAAITNRGWMREDVVAGDAITVRCHQLRDRSKGCLLGYVTPEGGEEKEWD